MKNQLNVSLLSKSAFILAATLVLANCGKAEKSSKVLATNQNSPTGYERDVTTYVPPGLPTLPALPTPPGTTTKPPTVSAADTLITTIYKTMLKRDPAASDLGYWKDGVREKGASFLLYGIGASGEFLNRTDALSDTAFVEQLYNGLLGRAPEAAGWASTTAHLGALTQSIGARAARITVVRSFAASPEAADRIKNAAF